MPLLTPRHDALWPTVAAACPTDIAHDADHVLRVYANALRLAPAAAVDPDLAGAAALVHDLVQIPKDDALRPFGGERSAAAAGAPLRAAGYTPAETDAIVEAVRTSSWSRGLPPTSPLGALLQDADRLDAIGAIGALRNAATAQAIAARRGSGALAHPTDPTGTSGRPLDDRAHALDHYPLKLYRLRDGFHLPAARAEAERRHARLEALAAAWAEEIAWAGGVWRP